MCKRQADNVPPTSVLLLAPSGAKQNNAEALGADTAKWWARQKADGTALTGHHPLRGMKYAVSRACMAERQAPSAPQGSA